MSKSSGRRQRISRVALPRHFLIPEMPIKDRAAMQGRILCLILANADRWKTEGILCATWLCMRNFSIVLHPSDSVGLSSISYDVLELLSHPQGYVKQAEGINDDLNAFVEEGDLHPLVDCLIKESHLNYFLDFGEYYIDKDLHNLVRRVGELLQVMLECCECYSIFVEFKQDDGVPFAMIFGLGMEHEDEDSRRIQQDIFIKFMSYVENNTSSYELVLLEVLSQANDSSAWSKF